MGNPWLITAAVLSGTAALLQVGCTFFGAPWYRFFGAGEKMARMAEAGSPVPAMVTAGIAGVHIIGLRQAWPQLSLTP